MQESCTLCGLAAAVGGITRIGLTDTAGGYKDLPRHTTVCLPIASVIMVDPLGQIRLPLDPVHHLGSVCSIHEPIGFRLLIFVYVVRMALTIPEQVSNHFVAVGNGTC